MVLCHQLQWSIIVVGHASTAEVQRGLMKRGIIQQGGDSKRSGTTAAVSSSFLRRSRRSKDAQKVG